MHRLDDLQGPHGGLGPLLATANENSSEGSAPDRSYVDGDSVRSHLENLGRCLDRLPIVPHCDDEFYVLHDTLRVR